MLKRARRSSRVSRTTRTTIGIVGGGMMGVVLAYELAKAGYRVTLYEGNDRLGGLTAHEDFGLFTWDRFYHCIVPTDLDLRDFLQEIGLWDAVRWTRTRTGIHIQNRTYPFDSGLDLARFDALSLGERARLALTVLRCGLVRRPRSLEGVTAREWFTRVGGKGPYQKIWQPLLRSKFGAGADRISPVYLVAKIKRMLTARPGLAGSEYLGYISGGYRRVWLRCTKLLSELGVDLRLESPVTGLEPAGSGARILTPQGSKRFSRVLLTVPFEAAHRLTNDWPGGSVIPPEVPRESIGVVCLILALRKSCCPYYVLNLTDEGLPFTGVIGMTNLIDPAEVNGLELLYVPRYVLADDPILGASNAEVFDRFLPALQKLLPDLDRSDIVGWFVRRARVVQNLQVLGYSQKVPQPEFGASPVSIVNNAQLLECDLHNSRVVRHARTAARALIHADRNPGDSSNATRADDRRRRLLHEPA